MACATSPWHTGKGKAHASGESWPRAQVVRPHCVTLRRCSCSSALSAASRRARVTLATYSLAGEAFCQRSEADCAWRRLLGPPGSLRSRVCSRALSHQASHARAYMAHCIVVASRRATA